MLKRTMAATMSRELVMHARGALCLLLMWQNGYPDREQDYRVKDAREGLEQAVKALKALRADTHYTS